MFCSTAAQTSQKNKINIFVIFIASADLKSSHAFGMFLCATEIPGKVAKAFQLDEKPSVGGTGTAILNGSYVTYEWNFPGKKWGLMEKKCVGGGKGLNKPCFALGLDFSGGPRTALSLLQWVSAQLSSASLGTESSQG